MKTIFFTLILLSQAIFANTNIAYDRNNIELEQILSKIVFNIPTIATKPVLNQSKGLYQIKNFDDVSITTIMLITLNAINNNNPNKVKKYTILSPLQQQQLHLVVSKNSRYKTIYDLNNRNVNVGREGNGIDLFTLSLSSVFKLKFNNQYNDTEASILNMIKGAGIDAVMFSDKVPSKYLNKYKDYIRLINIPTMKGFKQSLINKKVYKQNNDTISVASDTLLIATNKYVNNTPDDTNKLIDNIFKNSKIDKSAICNQSYMFPIYPYQKSTCTHYAQSLKSPNKSNYTRKISLSLVKKINTIEDIEIYNYALVKNILFGGLSKKTELKKINLLLKFYKEEGKSSKIIIKSYSSTGNANKAARKLFKILKKKGVSRGKMIIKSFNEQKCSNTSDNNCKYINSKITFEFI